MKNIALLIIFSLVLGSIASANPVMGQTDTNEDQYLLQLQGFAWNQAVLDTLIIIPDNESWWNPLYLDAMLRAVGQWNEALISFASNYTEFSYVSNVRISTTITNQAVEGYDLYINWTETPLSSTLDEIGLSKIVVLSTKVITNSSIILAAKTNHGTLLSEGDMQNIALHELGHSLGLGHSNYTADLMYPTYGIGDPAEFISTLDMYGVAAIFAWMTNPESYYPVSRWLTQNFVILPQDIEYKGLTVSEQNVRPPTPGDNPVIRFFIFIYELLIHPEIAIVVVFIVILFVVVALIPRKKQATVDS